MPILAKPTPETMKTLFEFTPPTWLGHAPIYMTPYAPFDVPYARSGSDDTDNTDDTDAKYLSVGLPQWRKNDDPTDLSVKVWRMPNKRWSRESEELPLHRVIDLAILLAHFLHSTPNADLELPAGTFDHQETPLSLKAQTKLSRGSAKYRRYCLTRLRDLRDLLNRFELPSESSQPVHQRHRDTDKGGRRFRS